MILVIWCLCSSSFFWCWPGCNVTTRPLVMILVIWCLCSSSFFWCWPGCNVTTRPLVMILMNFGDLMFVFLILLLMLTRLQCDNKTFGDDFDEFWWFDVCVPDPSFVDLAAMWQQDLLWWFWCILMIWCLCSWSFFWCSPAAMWQQDLWWWFLMNFDDLMFVFPILLLMLTRLQCDNKTFGDDFDDLMFAFLILLLILSRLQCDNKTFCDDFDGFWWFDVCVPDLFFDVDPAAMWQQDLWWWFWWFDVCVPHPSFDVDLLKCDNKAFGDDFGVFWMIWCLCSSSFFWRWPGCNVTTRPLVMILMNFDDLMLVFLILLLMLTRLQCDNKTFGDDFWWILMI